MDFRRLEVFTKVFQQKSFSKAGQALYLSQPTVSEHIRLLEEDLGLLLFDRQSKEVLPTPAGRLLYQYTVQLIALREESFRAIKQFRDKGTGDLLIGGSNIPGQYLLPPFRPVQRTVSPDSNPVMHRGYSAYPGKAFGRGHRIWNCRCPCGPSPDCLRFLG